MTQDTHSLGKYIYSLSLYYFLSHFHADEVDANKDIPVHCYHNEILCFSVEKGYSIIISDVKNELIWFGPIVVVSTLLSKY